MQYSHSLRVHSASMEHLRTQGSHSNIVVPLIGALEYDGGEFHTYPERQGWSEDMIFTQRDFSGNPSKSIESFFQTWLYFGFLICTFRIVGISVETADFLRISDEGKKIVTTERLPEYLQRWRQQYALTASAGDEDVKATQWPSIVNILRNVHQYASRYCSEYGLEFAIRHKQWNAQARPISPQVSLSIVALGQTIKSAACIIYGESEADLLLAWGSSSLLRDRLQASGWCPKDISAVSDPKDSIAELQYYLLTMPYPRNSIDHYQCTKSKCSGEQVDTDRYVTQHINSGCQCAMLDVEEDVLGVIRQGGMPVVSVTVVPGDFPTVEVDDYKLEPLSIDEYVAISHVWADGLGNRDVNGLPICQLIRLQTLVNDLYRAHPSISSRGSPSSERPTKFWMDTLCVPLHDDECRRSAISEMRNVYKMADRVLALDFWMMNGSIQDAISERSMRIMMSNWQRRLWTLSEAVLARHLYIQYKDGSQHIEGLLADCREHYLRSALFYNSIPARGVASTLPLQNLGPNVPISKRFLQLEYHIGQRATSWPSDETICFSNLLGLDTKRLLSIPREDLKGRMATFLRMVGTFRQQMIFDERPRLQAEGFGWSPASYLNRHEATVVIDRPEGDDRVGYLDSCGGLMVTYSGIKLGFLGGLLSDRFFVLTKDEPRFALFCSIRNDKPIPVDESLQYYIISYTSVRRLSGDGPSQSAAMVGFVKDPPKNGPIKVKFLCNVVLVQITESIIRDLERIQSHNSLVECAGLVLIDSTLMDEFQDWCVI